MGSVIPNRRALFFTHPATITSVHAAALNEILKKDLEITGAVEGLPISFMRLYGIRQGVDWEIDSDNKLVLIATGEIIEPKETLGKLFEKDAFKPSTLRSDTMADIEAICYKEPVYPVKHRPFQKPFLCHLFLKNGNKLTGKSTMLLWGSPLQRVDQNMTDAQNSAFEDAFSKMF